jgi:hypothetical protein
MKIIICVVSLLLFRSLSFATDLTLTDGRVYKNATIMSQTPLTVIVKHSAGLSSVSKNILPPELRTRYPADETAARDAEAKSKIAYTKARELEVAD